MSSNDGALADPAALKDWNRRVRRLANAYAPKYRPLVLSIGYNENLAEGRTFMKADTIVKKTARWTASGKPLQERYAKRLMAEMKAVDALRAEKRFRDDTGRQTSSYRALNTAIAVGRHGKPVAHDFCAPFDESPQVTEKKDTPRDTPQDTPRDTPQDTRTVSRLSENYQGTSSYLSPAARGDGEGRGGSFSGEAEKPGRENIYIVRTYKSGKQAYARLDRVHRLSAKAVSSEQVVALSGDEASWMWLTWPAESPESPETRGARIGYLLASADERAALIEELEADQRDARERDAQAAEQAEAEAQVATERGLWDSTEAERAKILATMPAFVPARVRPLAGARFQTWLDARSENFRQVWHHPEFDVVFAGSEYKRPGPDWISGYLRCAHWDRIKDQDVIPLRQAA